MYILHKVEFHDTYLGLKIICIICLSCCIAIIMCNIIYVKCQDNFSDQFVALTYMPEHLYVAIW